MRDTVSVLMATYAGETAYRLERSLEFMFAQTQAPDQLVLVADGPISEEQIAIIERYKKDPRIPELRDVHLPSNRGLGPALNAGLGHCAAQWVLRMDSDDISPPDRVEVQLGYVADHANVDVVGGWAEEFLEDAPLTRIKSTPTTHDAIRDALRWRNILAHSGILIRAKTMRAVGGYSSKYSLLEDWDLWVRLLLDGARFAVIPKVIIKVSVGRNQVARRGGWKYVGHEVRFRTHCWQIGFISFRQLAISTMAYAVFRLASASLRNRMYNAVRRDVSLEVSNAAGL